ncbi:MAG TPA: flagellar biosynthesis anti-sigma factor FlgM [Variovorax sp.]
MKIDQPAPSATPLHRTTATGPAPVNGADAAQRAREAAPASAQVHPLPGATGAAAADFDAARVAAIREDIRAGRYQIRPERIADGLLASVRDLLAPGQKGSGE